MGLSDHHREHELYSMVCKLSQFFVRFGMTLASGPHSPSLRLHPCSKVPHALRRLFLSHLLPHCAVPVRGICYSPLLKLSPPPPILIVALTLFAFFLRPPSLKYPMSPGSGHVGGAAVSNGAMGYSSPDSTAMKGASWRRKAPVCVCVVIVSQMLCFLQLAATLILLHLAWCDY